MSHREQAVEVRTRTAGGEWASRVFGVGERAELSSVDVSIDVDAVYAAAVDPPG